jgi:hypothetical protein
MATASYSTVSPWNKTPMTETYLDIWVPRAIPAEPDDYDYLIQPQYSYRPDLLAFDIYGNSKLWWVFMQRNVDIIYDPIYDFRAGVIIKLPKKSLLLRSLGIN